MGGGDNTGEKVWEVERRPGLGGGEKAGEKVWEVETTLERRSGHRY